MLAPRLAAVMAAIGAVSCAPVQEPARVAPGVAAARAAGPATAAEAAARGQRLASSACAGCHAVGPTGASPLPAAPPFRDIVHRVPLDQLEQRFAEGLVTAHPAMPAFVFRASEIDDLVAWLETLEDGR